MKLSTLSLEIKRIGDGLQKRKHFERRAFVVVASGESEKMMRGLITIRQKKTLKHTKIP